VVTAGRILRARCGDINFYLLADEVPGDEQDGGTIESNLIPGEILEYLSTEES